MKHYSSIYYNVYKKMYNLTYFGIHNEELVVSVWANAKMNEFAAIMGLCNLKHIEVAILDKKGYMKCIQSAWRTLKV